MSGGRSWKNSGDDLKKYEVHIGELPIWYWETVREFILYYCPDMHSTNKAILIELLNLTEPKPEKDSKMVELKRKTG